MALASAPSTPERASVPHLLRRSFTAPPKSIRTAGPIPETDIQGAETLYAHPAGKIVSFTTSPHQPAQRHSSVSDTRSDFQDEQAGSLPWASITERTVAAGPLQIYRVLGSVAFLSSGSILHPVLAKSRCWCVDGVSKFVLRIRPHNYYRIELPHESPQDEEKVEELKKVLPKILQYEVTACPFKRGFTVDLPEPPETPIQKRPWKPKIPMQQPSQESTERLDRLDEIEEVASREKYPEDLGVFHDPTPPQNPSQSNIAQSVDISAIAIPKEEPPQVDVADEVDRINQTEERRLEEPAELKTPTRPKSLKTGRTVTAPPQLSLQTSPPSTSLTHTIPAPNPEQEHDLSVSSSIESFHSFHSPISPLPPSPPSPDTSPENWGSSTIAIAKSRHRHTRDVSDVTITAPRPERWDMADDPSGDESTYHSPPDLPKTPTNSERPTQATEPQPQTPNQVRLRRARRRPRSPLPSSKNLYHAPYSPSNHISGHHLTTAIIQRTCSLLLGPPLQLVAMMLRIAVKIAKGAFRGGPGYAYGIGEGGRKIPCSWEESEEENSNSGSGDDAGGAGDARGRRKDDEEDGDEDEDEDEDDYGFSLGKTISGKDYRAKRYAWGAFGGGGTNGDGDGDGGAAMGESWDID